jgi:TetR/AcrR family transcriptional repressor of mexJK operon
MGRNFLSLLMSPQVLELHRVMVGEAARRPKMAELFFAAGPERTSALFAEYFRRATELGRLRVDDPETAAEHFQTLVKGMLHFRATLGLRPRPTRAQARAQVARAVDAFLRAYGPTGRE